MNYSTSHIRFSQKVNTPDALTEPQGFLGPNYRTVLNFWTYLDKLTIEQLTEVSKTTAESSIDLGDFQDIRNTAESTIGMCYLSSVYEASILSSANDDYLVEATTMATEELVGMHRLFAKGKQLRYVPMFDFTVNRDFHLLDTKEIDRLIARLNSFNDKGQQFVFNLSYETNESELSSSYAVNNNPNNLVLTTNF